MNSTITQILKILDEGLPHPKETSPCYFYKMWHLDRYVYNVIGMYVGGPTEDNSFHIHNTLNQEDFEDSAENTVKMILKDFFVSDLYSESHKEVLKSHQPFLELCKKLNIKL